MSFSPEKNRFVIKKTGKSPRFLIKQQLSQNANVCVRLGHGSFFHSFFIDF